MKTFLSICLATTFLWFLLPTPGAAQYQFGYLSYQKALQSLPEYATAQSSLRALKEKYDTEAKYNEEKFQRMFADFLAGQKSFPQEILLKRQRELQVAMEQGMAFRKDAERQLGNAEQAMIKPLVLKLDSILGEIGRENGFIFILNTDNRDFPFIHLQAGKDLQEIVIARINGQIIPITSETPAEGENTTPAEAPAPAEGAPQSAPEQAPTSQEGQQ